MKRKSPKNHRRKKRAITRKCSNEAITGRWTFTNSDVTFYYDGSTTTTINSPSSSFSNDGFVEGNIITISCATEPKRSKKVHVARRRIPKRNNNGKWIITSVGSGSLTIADKNSLYNS